MEAHPGGLYLLKSVSGRTARGSFREVGSLAGFASFDDDGEIAAFTPASHVGGQGGDFIAP